MRTTNIGRLPRSRELYCVRLSKVTDEVVQVGFNLRGRRPVVEGRQARVGVARIQITIALIRGTKTTLDPFSSRSPVPVP